MGTVTIPKKEYKELVEKKLRYEYLRGVMEEDIFSPPPTKKIKEIIDGFRATRKYNRQFIKDLERGLKRSSYFRS